MQAAQVKGYETVISIDVFIGGEKVDVPITVSLPYKLKGNEDPKAVKVWHMADDGTLTDLKGVYDAATGMITFSINQQSYFVVGYDPIALWENIYSDIADNQWYFRSVAYANLNGLMNGMGHGLFAPQSNMTRAMFVTVLWNLENNPIPEGVESFNDVNGEAWYYDAVIWAADNGLAFGVGGDNFAPDRPITRQEMAAILYRYATFKGYEFPINRAMPAFSDINDVEWWARVAIADLAKAGMLNGKGHGILAPTATATRAEVSQLFMNFMRFVIMPELEEADDDDDTDVNGEAKKEDEDELE